MCEKIVDETTKVSVLDKEMFVVKGQILYRRTSTGGLVVPKGLRPTVLHLGHSIPWSGRLGQTKTYARIAAHFYWLQMYLEVLEYCKTCAECQQTAPGKKGDRAPLIPMPVIDEELWMLLAP